MPGETTITVQKEVFARLLRDWDVLLAESPARNMFSTPHWHELCWEHLTGDNWELLLLSIKDGSHQVGIAPLRRRGETISFIGDVEVSDYQDFIIRTGQEETFFRVLVDALEHEDWTTLDLHGLTADSPALERLPALARGLGLVASVEQQFVAPGMDLPESWDSFKTSLNKKSRHELRRKLRRLEANASFSHYAITGPDVDAGIDDFLRLHRASSEQKSVFMDRHMEGFFRAMISRLAGEGWVKLYFLEVDGRRVSTALCFEYGGESLLYNSGFDPAFRALSVGLLLKAFCIRDAIESGMKRFDFLRGQEHYKYELGGVDAPIYRLLVQRA